MRDDAVLGRALPLGWETLRGEAGEKVHRVHRTCRSIGVGDTKTNTITDMSLRRSTKTRRTMTSHMRPFL